MEPTWSPEHHAAMTQLGELAGWATVPHPADTVVVRLALRTAYDRWNPNVTGHSAGWDRLELIEDVWLAAAVGW